MPLFYLRRLKGRERTDRANRHLACYLAFVAGAANAGGWMAVRQYTFFGLTAHAYVGMAAMPVADDLRRLTTANATA